ncbi:unnamed protein product [Hymenolepis diminuta]|uniref:Sugar ABC transporter permease n=1 Tax=Hymenolepis diminuta TaxID=6216 RepID=A0A0R3SMS2_HYMDI|nr:unnamed protein product [Hymenolepis diminuta]
MAVVLVALIEARRRQFLSALTLEEAKQNPAENILYDTTPYSKIQQFGFSALVVYGVLILFTSSLALGARLNDVRSRKRVNL